jgi:hypothetical protein
MLMKKLLIILTLINLFWVNNRILIIQPSTYPAKAPSVWLKESPEIRWLMQQKGEFKVSGLDFPFYCGHWVKLRTLGYMGGFRDKKLSDYLGGEDGTNTWRGTTEEARKYGIKYFIQEGKVFEISGQARVY